MDGVASSKHYRKASHTAERVAYEVRQAILHRELLPSEHVRQQFWATRLGVSSGPTREGLKMLVAERLLSYDAHRGYFVSRIDDAEMSQVYLIRRVLEEEVLRSIRWPSDVEIAHFVELKDVILTFLLNGDVHGALEAVREFSFSLFELSSLDLLVRETKRYWEMAVVYRALAFRSDEDQAHITEEFYEVLIRCLKRQDREGLIALNSRQRAGVPMRVEEGHRASELGPVTTSF